MRQFIDFSSARIYLLPLWSVTDMMVLLVVALIVMIGILSNGTPLKTRLSPDSAGIYDFLQDREEEEKKHLAQIFSLTVRIISLLLIVNFSCRVIYGGEAPKYHCLANSYTAWNLTNWVKAQSDSYIQPLPVTI